MCGVLINGDARRLPLADASVQCVITSPPYWGLRDYGVDGQIGLEPTIQAYVTSMVQVFREVWRVLRDDGALWLNLGDTYIGAGYSNHRNTGGAQRVDGGKPRHISSARAGLPNKNLAGIPWRVALALQADGWYLRQDIIWHKPNPLPESVKDRCTRSHEYIFLLTKQPRYYFDGAAIAEPAVGGHSGTAAMIRRQRSVRGQALVPGNRPSHRPDRAAVAYNGPFRNRRSVWTVATRPFHGAHFATFPPALVEPMVLAGSRPGDLVLDPFAGTATVGAVCIQHHRRFVGVELNREYIRLARGRLGVVQMALPV